MNKALRTTSAILAGLTLTATIALATPNAMHQMHNAMSKTNLNINMGALNGSKQDGTAFVRDVPGGGAVQVTVSVMNQPKGTSQPAHIHKGRCPNVDPAPWKALHNLVNGKSVTTLKGVTVAQIKAGTYAINVHDQHNLKHYVSCGNL
ncbi:MAG: hypothetical protein JO165_07305 [Candidatus Eremiobacteraeota bacterium]|nr:hypothetical protein [Candidatus Eremiobacteraeota bacterium]